MYLNMILTTVQNFISATNNATWNNELTILKSVWGITWINLKYFNYRCETFLQSVPKKIRYRLLRTFCDPTRNRRKRVGSIKVFSNDLHLSRKSVKNAYLNRSRQKAILDFWVSIEMDYQIVAKVSVRNGRKKIHENNDNFGNNQCFTRVISVLSSVHVEQRQRVSYKSGLESCEKVS